ncbi:glycerol-3-phosphate responsive antiterminator [Ornithinibacillus bavariensis]|uniref:Glycerol uptake operon antiterminator regulatory protein n=1 Tax=Ornithinibacillus bavariensis TaxID=545502 RepID=A0A919X6U4_9BACI|nr:glycerol-3-phosphate responsive antiterminator [Ornithinibacillus bavariensis]GIO27021.1 glycerol uptake operon antiterminator regulatory protein [Ornithinibacillus bavariensis]HAM80095.1 glycerol-3-phosphate responsive antiterminator [Ornithinibacillus sp.]
MDNIVDLVQSQVIASVKHEDHLDMAIHSNSNIIFLLTGDLMTTKDYLDRLKKYNKTTFVHIDFIDGLSNTKSAIQYITEVWQPKGIITTKSNLIKYAKEEGLMAIQRIFLIDRNAMKKGIEIAHTCKPDAIEVLPGVMPQIIDKLTKLTHLPIIAGGLVSNRTEINNGLEAGALAISSGDPKLWNLNI